MWTTARGRARPEARAASRPVAPALAVWVWRTSGRLLLISVRSARIARVSARERELALEDRELEELHAELVGDVLHRLLAGCERPRDDDDVVPAPGLLVRELEDVERGAADVEARDHVHDPHDGCGRAAGGASDGATAVRPIVSQKMAASGMPPKSAAPLSPPASAATQAAGR